EQEILRAGAGAARIRDGPPVRRCLRIHPGRTSRLLGDERKGGHADPSRVSCAEQGGGRRVLQGGDGGGREGQRRSWTSRRLWVRGVRAGSGRAQRGGSHLGRGVGRRVERQTAAGRSPAPAEVPVDFE